MAAPIGPINVEIVRRGLRGGFATGWLVGLGAATADVIYRVLVVGRLTPVADGAALRVPLYLAGAAVLAYLRWGSVRAALTGPPAVGGAPSGRRSFATGFVMAVANPMGIVYWLSAGAALVASAVERAGQGGAPVLVGGVFVGIIGWVGSYPGKSPLRVGRGDALGDWAERPDALGFWRLLRRPRH